ncbi:phage tail protein [Azospirillum sp. B2RO_4]|uniref:phage tail protein n=1 Tax=Azospirillum sp. B2RO_4 TaxID=3027796 RepID=UPI003DA7E877
MGEQYIGEIRIFPYNNIPGDWVACNGQLLNIQQYVALYSLLGTTFGGDGKTTFGVPDLRGRCVVGSEGSAQGVPSQVGGKAGSETVTLTLAQMPAHTHQLVGTSSNATSANPTNGFFAVPAAPSTLPPPVPAAPPIYGQPQANALVALNPTAVTSKGGGEAHENRQPFMALTYCMAVLGYYPQRN